MVIHVLFIFKNQWKFFTIIPIAGSKAEQEDLITMCGQSFLHQIDDRNNEQASEYP